MKLFGKSIDFSLRPFASLTLGRLASGLKPEVVFLCVALSLGFALTVIVPPFQAPDEQHHFFKAYQVSEGIMIGEHSRTEYLPRSLKHVWQMTERGLTGHPDTKIAPGNILPVFSVPLNPDDRSSIASLAYLYSPHCYFPQALGLFVGRHLGIGPLALLYVARFVTLVCCVFLFYWSIKKTPVLKWVFCLLACMPTSIALTASCSQDGIINSLAFLFTASVFDIAYSPEKNFTIRSVFLPAIVGGLFAAAKAGAYTPMLALFLFIPIRKANSSSRYVALVVLGVVPALIGLAVWAIGSLQLIKPLIDSVSATPGEVNGSSLLLGICKAPQQYLLLLAKTTIVDARAYVGQFVGVLRWFDVVVPGWLMKTYVAMLIAVALAEKDSPSLHVTVLHKIIVVLVIGIVYIYIQTAQFCTFSPLGRGVIIGFQGRYLIPLGPIFCLLFQNPWRMLGSRIEYFLPIAVTVFLLVVIPTTLQTVVARYYGEPEATWLMPVGLEHSRMYIPSVPIIASDNFSQTFVSPSDCLTGVAVHMAYTSTSSDDVIRGYRFLLKECGSCKPVREVGSESFKIEKDQPVSILFDPIPFSKDKKYEFTLVPVGKVEEPVSIQLSDPGLYPEGETIVHGEKIDRSVFFYLFFTSCSSTQQTGQ